MDPPTMVKTVFKYTSSQQPMFSVLQSPPLHYTSSDPTNFQDISFSSYIKSKDPCPIDDTEISIFDAQKYFSDGAEKQQVHLHPPNDVVVNVNTRPSSVSSVDTSSYGRNFRTRSFHATPTASSEASWNSQTGLLANPPGSMGVSLRNVSGEDGRKGGSVARKWIFGRKCCCTGKKSVQVKEAINLSDSDNGGTAVERDGNGSTVYVKKDSYKVKPMSSSILSGLSHMEIQPHKASVVLAPNSLRLSPPENEFPKTDPPRQQRISASGRTFVDGTGGFSFPILNTSTASTKPALKGMIMTKSAIMEDPPRDSLEVFQPMHDQIPSDNPVNLNSRPHFSSGSPRVIANTDDDMGSDASSDLFEIESFSTQTTSYPMYRRRDSLDEVPTFNARRFATANGLNLNAGGGGNIQYGRRSLDEPPTPSVAATECYAPSEVSIDWSVTTVEGFDRASVSNFSVSASEVGTAAFLRQRLQQQQEEESGKRKGNGGGGGLLLMSCRQEKAVSVGPQPVKCVEVGGRPPRAGKAALGNDHSARLSLAFAA